MWGRCDPGLGAESQHAKNTQHITTGHRLYHPAVWLTVAILCCAVLELVVESSLSLPARVKVRVKVRVRVGKHGS